MKFKETELKIIEPFFLPQLQEGTIPTLATDHLEAEFAHWVSSWRLDDELLSVTLMLPRGVPVVMPHADSLLAHAQIIVVDALKAVSFTLAEFERLQLIAQIIAQQA